MSPRFQAIIVGLIGVMAFYRVLFRPLAGILLNQIASHYLKAGNIGRAFAFKKWAGRFLRAHCH